MIPCLFRGRENERPSTKPAPVLGQGFGWYWGDFAPLPFLLVFNVRRPTGKVGPHQHRFF